MSKHVQYLEGVVIEVDDDGDDGYGDDGADNANVRGFARGAATEIRASLEESLAVLGKIAGACSAALAQAPDRPAQVEITFGLEANGEAGVFTVGKLGGKANFSVKMSWRHDA